MTQLVRVKVWKETTIFAFEVKVKVIQMARWLKYGEMTPMANMIKVWRYFKGVTIETNIFAFEVKVTIGLWSTCPEDWVAKKG